MSFNQERCWSEEARIKRNKTWNEKYYSNPDFALARSKKAQETKKIRVYTVSLETRKKISDRLIKEYASGKRIYKTVLSSPEIIAKRKLTMRKKEPGWSSFWRGGRRKILYPWYWEDKKLKKYIFERDNFQCYECGGHPLVTHHINEIKWDCRLENLLTLCNPCNVKASLKRWRYRNIEYSLAAKQRQEEARYQYIPSWAIIPEGQKIWELIQKGVNCSDIQSLMET